MYVLSLRNNQSSQTPTSAYFSSRSEESVAGRMQMETAFGIFQRLRIPFMIPFVIHSL